MNGVEKWRKGCSERVVREIINIMLGFFLMFLCKLLEEELCGKNEVFWKGNEGGKISGW